MKNILITYGDDRYYFSRLRLAKQARKSGFFDKVRVYTPDNLSPEIKGGELFKQSRGGGLWVWKPYIISQALKQCDNGDVVWYADSGCAINPDSGEWHELSAKLTDKDSLFFTYRDDYDYHWQQFGINSVKLKHWTKPLARKFLIEYAGSDSFLEMPSLWGGFMAFKKTGNEVIIDEWLRMMLSHPEIVCDPAGSELESLPEDFNQHRHDQSLLSCIVRKNQKEANALIVEETAESRIGNPAVIAERYRAGKTSFWPDIRTRIYFLFHDR